MLLPKTKFITKKYYNSLNCDQIQKNFQGFILQEINSYKPLYFFLNSSKLFHFVSLLAIIGFLVGHLNFKLLSFHKIPSSYLGA